MLEMTSLSTQTDLNIELILNFISNDLPRVVSHEIVPLLLKILTQPKDSQITDLSKSLQRQIQDAIRGILEKSLPSWQGIEENMHDSSSNLPVKRRKIGHSPVLVGHLQPTCGICKKTFDTYPLLCNHYTFVHKEEKSNLALACDMCQFSTTMPLGIAAHIKNSHINYKQFDMQQSLKCGWGGWCSTAFPTKKSLKLHKAGHRRRGDISKCPKCNVMFEFESQLSTHLKHSFSCGSQVPLNVVDNKESGDSISGVIDKSGVNNKSGIDSISGVIDKSGVNNKSGIDSKSGVDSQSSVTQSHSVPNDTANMIGNAILSALSAGGESIAKGTSQKDTTQKESNQKVIHQKNPLRKDIPLKDDIIPTISLSASPTVCVPTVESVMADIATGDVRRSLIMDTTTGKPIPVTEFVDKKNADLLNFPLSKAYVISSNTIRKNNSKLPCHFCNRTFVSRQILSCHLEKVHIQKKTLSCSQCHMLFATFQEVDSHFHRVHRKKKVAKQCSDFEDGIHPVDTQTGNIVPNSKEEVFISDSKKVTVNTVSNSIPNSGKFTSADDTSQSLIRKTNSKTRSGRKTKAP